MCTAGKKKNLLRDINDNYILTYIKAFIYNILLLKRAKQIPCHNFCNEKLRQGMPVEYYII